MVKLEDIIADLEREIDEVIQRYENEWFLDIDYDVELKVAAKYYGDGYEN